MVIQLHRFPPPSGAVLRCLLQAKLHTLRTFFPGEEEEIRIELLAEEKLARERTPFSVRPVDRTQVETINSGLF